MKSELRLRCIVPWLKCFLLSSDLFVILLTFLYPTRRWLMGFVRLEQKYCLHNGCCSWRRNSTLLWFSSRFILSRQTTIYKTQHRKLKIEQHEPLLKRRWSGMASSSSSTCGTRRVILLWFSSRFILSRLVTFCFVILTFLYCFVFISFDSGYVPFVVITIRFFPH
jgi:hypothetical protein